jgi:hypothetical protein
MLNEQVNVQREKIQGLEGILESQTRKVVSHHKNGNGAEKVVVNGIGKQQSSQVEAEVQNLKLTIQKLIVDNERKV